MLTLRLSAFPALLRSFTLFCCAASFLILVGCKGGYSYSLNKSVVYDPNGPGDPNATLLRDPSLQACLNQIINRDQQPMPLNQITLLACPGSEVQSLVGIEKLSNLEQLELSDNQIADLRPLADLEKLRVLSIRNNPLTTLKPLRKLPLLRFLSVQGNELLPCEELAQWKAKLNNTLNAPGSCRE